MANKHIKRLTPLIVTEMKIKNHNEIIRTQLSERLKYKIMTMPNDSEGENAEELAHS